MGAGLAGTGQGNACWTLVQSISRDKRYTNYYNSYTHTSDYMQSGKSLKSWQQDGNMNMIVAVEKFNSIFKHSLGTVMTRYV